MNWHTFFDFGTMASRHLVSVYTGVWLVGELSRLDRLELAQYEESRN